MERFNFKQLNVWHKAMDFTDHCFDITEKIKGHYRLVEQLEAASASVPQNIAEGKGRNSNKDFVKFLYYSRGSLFESLTVLYLFQRRNYISNEKLVKLEGDAFEILKMLNALISSKQ
jgi:four helix bundle protein